MASYNRLLQSLSFVINRYSNLPVVARFQIYDEFQSYLLEQEFRIQNLEKQIKTLENKLSSQVLANQVANQVASVENPIAGNPINGVLMIVKEKEKSLMNIH